MHNQNADGIHRSVREGIIVGGRRAVASPHSGNRSDRGAVVAGSRSRPRANSSRSSAGCFS
jgi:hypothetical protein